MLSGVRYWVCGCVGACCLKASLRRTSLSFLSSEILSMTSTTFCKRQSSPPSCVTIFAWLCFSANNMLCIFGRMVHYFGTNQPEWLLAAAFYVQLKSFSLLAKLPDDSAIQPVRHTYLLPTDRLATDRSVSSHLGLCLTRWELLAATSVTAWPTDRSRTVRFSGLLVLEFFFPFHFVSLGNDAIDDGLESWSSRLMYGMIDIHTVSILFPSTFSTWLAPPPADLLVFCMRPLIYLFDRNTS